MNKYPFTDDELREAAGIVRENMLRSLPQETDHEFSKEFEEKIDLMYRNYVRRRRIKRTARRLSAAVLALVILGSSVMLTNANAKGLVVKWFKETVKSVAPEIDPDIDFIVYKYHSDQTIENSLPVYKPEWLPKGYRLSHELKLPLPDYGLKKPYTKTVTERIFDYTNNYGDTIQIMYVYIEDDTRTGVQLDKDTEYESVSIKGIEGDYYNDNGYKNLIWADENEGILFHISGHADKDELIRVAESMKKQE